MGEWIANTIHPCNRILLSNIKEGITGRPNNVDEAQEGMMPSERIQTETESISMLVC